MRNMKGCREVVTLFAAVAVAFCSSGAVFAAGAGPINVKAEASKGASCIKALPVRYREALLAEMSGLLYMDDGSDPYLPGTGYEIIDNQKVTYQNISSAAKFIGSDGKVYSFSAIAYDKMSKARVQKSWQQAKLYISHAGKDEVLRTFEKNIAVLKEKRAAFCLKNMPQEYKDAFLAENSHLLFLQNGESATTDELRSETIRGLKMSYHHIKPGAIFVGSDGRRYDFFALSKTRYEKLSRVQVLWQESKYVMSLMGKEEFLQLFRADIAKLRAAKEDAQK